MKEIILYKEHGNIIILIEKDNTTYQEVEHVLWNKKLKATKICNDYNYTLKVNGNVVWQGNFKERLKNNVSDNNLKLEEECNVLLPLIDIPIDTLLKIRTPYQMNEYIKSKQEEKEKQEFEMMKEVYSLGISGELYTNWRYLENNRRQLLFDRIMDINSPEHKKFMSNLVDPLITILISKNKMVDCLDKLETSIFELREKLKKYPEIVTMLCMEYKIDINDLINFDEKIDSKKSQKM